MKILEIIPSLNEVGGGEKFFVDLCNSFSRNFSNEVEIVAISLYECKNSFLNTKINKSINIYYLNKHKGIDLKTSLELRAVIRKEKPDIIHCHLSSLITLFLSQLFARKIKIYYTLHNMVGDGFRKEKFLIFLNKIKFLKVIAVSKIVANSFEKKSGIKIEFVNNGVDIEEYDNTIPINERSIDFLCVGSFSPVKNQEFIIRAFQEANIDNALVFLGDGDTLNYCKELCNNLHLTDKVTFAGKVCNVSDYMSNSKVLLIGSKSEANPMIINEAFCSGMFVVSTNVGGIPDLIDEQNGILVSDFEEKTFSKKIVQVINDVKRLEDNRKRLMSLKSKYSINECAFNYLLIFKGVYK